MIAYTYPGEICAWKKRIRVRAPPANFNIKNGSEIHYITRVQLPSGGPAFKQGTDRREVF